MSSIHYIYTEMRYRVLYIIYSIFCTCVTCYYCQLELIYLLSRPFIFLQQTIQTTGVSEALSTTFRLCFYIGIATSILTCCYQYWSFIVSSCYEFERKKYTLFFLCLISILLLELYCIYFYILPIVSSFFSSFQVYVERFPDAEDIDLTSPYGKDGKIIEMSPRIESLFVVTSRIISVLCVVFQIPWFFLLLFYFEYCNCFTISRYRKQIYFFIICISALFSPPDLLSQFVCCLVLIFFFEFSLWIGCIFSLFKSTHTNSISFLPTHFFLLTK